MSGHPAFFFFFFFKSWPPEAVAWGITAFVKQTSSMVSLIAAPAAFTPLEVRVFPLMDLGGEWGHVNGKVELKVFSLDWVLKISMFPSLELYAGAWVYNVT